MLTVVVASHNPVKVRATFSGFRKMFPGQDIQIESVSAISEVGDQPMSSEETYYGALSRARHAMAQTPAADFWLGIEGGVEEFHGDLAAFAWIVVLSEDMTGKSRTGTFLLPPGVAELVREGKELGDADDIIFNRSNSKQENGAVGILTANVVDRMQLYEQAIILALVPFKNRTLYR